MSPSVATSLGARSVRRVAQHRLLSVSAQPSAAAANKPKQTYSEYDFPEKHEAPVITRTGPTAARPPPPSPSSPSRTIPASRSIGPDRPGFIPPNVARESLEVPRPEITTLPNGVRVGSVETYSQVSTVGVLLDYGSRQEVDECAVPGGGGRTVSTAGVNHLSELLAFQSTSRHGAEEVKNVMENLGGATFAQSSREQMMYCVDVLRPNVGEAFGLLGDTINDPRIDDAEVEEMKHVVGYQLMDMMPQVMLGEGLQMAGYGPVDGKPQQLGRPHLCTAEGLPGLTAESVRAYREQNLLNNPKGIVVAGSGIEHGRLVELADEAFGSMTQSDGGAAGDRTVPSAYTGGEYRLEQPPSPNPAKEEFTHVALAFETGGWHSPDLVPVCVLQTLLGGGSSFSAGGPGKGMYSRLYRTVLNRWSWVESAEAFTSFHSESGLWGISGSCRPEAAGQMTAAVVEQFHALEGGLVGDEELSRARNMLKCNVLTQLESRLVLFEDVGRQISTYGKVEDAASMCEKIDSVTGEDIQRIVRETLTRPVTMSTVGRDISRVPRLDDVSRMLGSRPKKRSWF